MDEEIDDEPHPESLEDLLDLLEERGAQGGRVTLGGMMDAVGRRSFGPLLLLAGLIAVSPLSGIPGMPTTVATIVALVAGQLLFRRDHFWIPQWVEHRAISEKNLFKALRFLRKPARFVDRFLRPRLEFLTRHTGTYVVAVLCLLVAATMPPLEPLPFAASIAGAALAIFGLALVAHDGVLVLIGLAFTLATIGVVIWKLV
ncbi:exopolysaccharide biosynthesis protein [soil metagenome]